MRGGISSSFVVASMEQGQLSQGQRKVVLAQHDPQISIWSQVAVQTLGIHVALGGNIGYQPVPQVPTRHQASLWRSSASLDCDYLYFLSIINFL